MNRTSFFKLKMFLLCLYQVKLAVFNQCILTKKLLNKLNFTFLFSSFRCNIENNDDQNKLTRILRTNVLNSRTIYLHIYLYAINAIGNRIFVIYVLGYMFLWHRDIKNL